ncbi:hypothetical protein [Nostoc sp. UHCC 0251]|uniref:hypothetical protein n=1 Tax=Nostoc sp. UHCC 0251 TaxID=3110240 RepID=UPI002B21254F|nr:hypothetical protein [Nostoc sp. UHCC 0251]MEA5626760.1 hypothetical protein [Nostoc sp. UHCC 0251]
MRSGRTRGEIREAIASTASTKHKHHQYIGSSFAIECGIEERSHLAWYKIFSRPIMLVY